MNIVTRIADGITQDFYFEFKFFMKSDVVIEVNSAPAVKYNLIPTQAGLNADFKFIGGRVHFDKPPKPNDIIKIYRKLPPKRFTDYQATSLYDPEILNQDLNYLLEMIKDTQDSLVESMSQSSGGPDLSALTSVFERIDQISASLNTLTRRVENLEITGQPDQPGDLEELTRLSASLDNVCAALADLSDTMESHAADLLALNGRCTQIEQQVENIPAPTPILPDNIDYVVEWQEPTAENNYTWYRKYASGWVEQGGQIVNPNGNLITITLPIAMNDSNYIYNDCFEGIHNAESSPWRIIDSSGVLISKTQTGFSRYMPNSTNCIRWTVCGVSV